VIRPVPPAGRDVDVTALLEDCGGREHRVLGGRLDQAHLDRDERGLLFELWAADGDYRDRDAIAAWVAEVADALVGRPVPSTTQ
jgi:menaquinone-dependent protoporphyrinogen oxidase